MFRAAAVTLLLALAASGTGALDNRYPELGSISWERDYEQALQRAAQGGRPVLILFQEVPGCATCRDYGLRVLSHPLLAEAVEELFVPVAVFNNRPGPDAEVLRLFEEPSWNNPVVRIVDAAGRELTRRLAGDYSPGGLSGAMIAALRAQRAPVPAYLESLHTELSAQGSVQRAVFSMFCFWEGEVKLGGIEGVVASRAGFLEGGEIVEVQFDSSRLSYRQLLERALRLRCADRVYPLDAGQEAAARRLVGRERIRSLDSVRQTIRWDENTKYYLSRTPYRFLPMTEYQQMLANRAVYRGESPEGLLSPRQRRVMEFIRRHPGRSFEPRIAAADLRQGWHEVWQLVGER